MAIFGFVRRRFAVFSKLLRNFKEKYQLACTLLLKTGLLPSIGSFANPWCTSKMHYVVECVDGNFSSVGM
jgi:hypothetical protein